MQVTDTQREAMKSLLNGPANIAAVHAGRLVTLGYVEKTGQSALQRGYSHVSLTDAGRALLNA